VADRTDKAQSDSRRKLLRQILGMSVSMPLARWGILPAWAAMQKPNAQSQSTPATKSPFSQDDEQLLEELERASFRYFWERTDPQTGLVKDRHNVRQDDHGVVASIAATGFGLTALCIGEKRGFVSPPDARGRVLATLRFLWNKLPNHRGFFYHFANINTGERLWDSEVSSVDTAILLCGVLASRQHFRSPEIHRLGSAIFNRVDWNWLSGDTPLLPQGWLPEFGFLPYRWDYYSELMMMYLLGLGSAAHPLPPEAWDAWKRTTFEYDGLRYIGSFAPLFVHQYSQAWFDFRDKRDRYADYFQNSIIATEVHRRFCLELAEQFPDYGEDFWGITASDSDQGYVIWGGPPAVGNIDGTVVPSAAAGSLPFLPQATMRVIRTIRTRYGSAWCDYGFVNAFNPLRNWYDTDVIGIDTGITMLMAENARTGFVWDTFMKNPEAKRGMDRAGFKPYQPSGSPLASEVPSLANSAEQTTSQHR
jgi:hypothetical protein